ncbi:hypothetical protein BDV11DRAFT_176863 [Aspergillus similis]
MERPAFLISTATSQPTKRNTRIPPILAAGKASSFSPVSSSTTAEPIFSRIATLSRQKLSAEAAGGDPDLRRCLGHHRLLTRSVHEAKEGMKRYLEEMLESESEDDDDIYGEYEFGKGEVLFQEDVFVDEEDDDEDELHDEDEDEDVEDECPTVEEVEVVAPPASITVSTDPAQDPGTCAKDQSPTPVPPPVPAPRAPRSNSTPGPVWMKEKIVGAMRGLVRRRNSTSLPPSPVSPPAPPPSTASPPAAAFETEAQSALAHMAAKNASCSQIPVYIHIHEHLSKPARTLERSQSQSQLQRKAQGHGSSITMRGRQYAQRLGLKVAVAVPVTT